MQILIILFVAFYNVDVSASIGLQEFDKYKSNNALLESDIQRLQEVVSKDNNKLYTETLNQYKYLLSKYEILNSRLSLINFSVDAGSSGWTNIKRISRNLSTLCEEGQVDLRACLEGIERLRTFVIHSSLEGSDKESVISFLNDYTAEAKIVATFNEAFITKFNQGSSAVNDRKFLLKKSSAIVISVKPVADQVKTVQSSLETTTLPQIKQSPPILDIGSEEISKKTKNSFRESFSIVEGIINSITAKDLMISIASLSFFLILFIIIHFMSRKRQIKSFQYKIFKIAKNNEMKVKIFGRSDFSGIKDVSLLERKLLDSFLHSKLVAKTAHLKFKVKNNILQVEALYFSKRSVQNFLDKESLVFQQSLESLKQTVELNGGELSYTNKFNYRGEIIQTSYIISLPRI